MSTKKRIMTLILSVAIALSSVMIQEPKKVSADAPDIYQVNGKYSLTTNKLVTKCKLVTADSTLKKKTRTYTITSKTKFYLVNDDYSKKQLKGNKLKKKIKSANKKNVTIQFKEKNGKVIFIWFI